MLHVHVNRTEFRHIADRGRAHAEGHFAFNNDQNSH